MKLPPYRIGVFDRKTVPSEGGANTLLGILREKLSPLLSTRTTEIVTLPASVTSRWRRPMRYLIWKLARMFGWRFPLWDFRPTCRKLRLDMVYFAVPIFAKVDLPYVFTLWDLGHRTIPQFPEFNSASESREDREILCQRMLRQASYVVTGNRAGAGEVCKFYDLSPERVVPIPFPNPDFSGITAIRPTWVPRRPYFFYPAQNWLHKNHLTLIKALTLLPAADAAFDLVFVGSDKGNLTLLQSTAVQLGVAKRVHFGGFVTTGELKALYQDAAGLVFASLLGPNNLPQQEAAVLGCPIILSDLPGHREQLADGALYVDPLDAKAWSEAMVRLVNDDALRTGLVARARRAVANYTVENYAARLGELLSPPDARCSSRTAAL